MPGTETVAAYQTADLILLNGAGYAKWTSRVGLPRSRLVDTSRRFKGEYVREADGISHGRGGKHAHGGVAFTTWLDFNQAAQQVEAIAQAQSVSAPMQRNSLNETYSRFRRTWSSSMSVSRN